MAIEKLPEFSKTGQKNTDGLDQEAGFPVNLKPARQWFNFLFNKLTSTINALIDENYIRHDEIVDNLTTNDAKKPLSAKQGRELQVKKLNRTSSSNQKFDLSQRNFDGIHTEYTWLNSPSNNIAGTLFFNYSNDWVGKLFFDISSNRMYSQSFQGGDTATVWQKFAYLDDNVSSASKLEKSRKIFGHDFDGTSDLSNAVAIEYGGTGAQNSAQARINLGLGLVATEDCLPVSKGGTGSTTASNARVNLGLGNAATSDIGVSSGNVLGVGSAGLATRLVAELSTSDMASKKPSEIYAYLQSRNPLSGDKTYYFCSNGSTGSNGFPDAYGTLRGYHVADNSYSYCWQIFTAINGRDQYVRSPTSATTWSEWKKYFYHGEYGIGTEKNSVTDISTKNSAATKGSIWSQLENGTIYSGITLPYSSDWVTQIRSDMASKNTSIRYFIGGSTWSEWEKIYTSKDTIPVSNGGTGAQNSAQARINLGLGLVATEDCLPVSKGGTGSTTASNARVNLGLGNAATTDVGVLSGNVLGAGSAGLATRLVAELSTSDIASKKPSEIYAYLQSKNALSGDKTYYFCNNGSTGSNGFPDAYGTLRGYHVADNNYSYCWQIFTAINGRDQYVRSPTGVSTWSEWRKYAFTDSIKNLGENGYVIHPDGRVEQWGYVAGGIDEQIYTVNFPITFPNQCLNIQVSRMRKYSTVAVVDADGGALVVEGTITRSSFVVDHQRFNSSSVGSLGGTMWRATGY